MRCRVRRWLTLGLSLLFAGCSLTPAIEFDPAIQQQLTPQAELTATPFILQADFQCGPASLAMVMNYHGADISPQTLARQVFTPKAKGSFPVEMDIASRRQGFISFPVANLESLLREIDAGHPVLVLQNLGISWYPMWHFAVVVGYDLQQRVLILRSGDLPRRITPMSVFENTWKRSDHWARAVLPPTQIPASADPIRYIRYINGLEHVGQQALALTAYRAASLTWPDTTLVRFALANALLSNNQPDAALQEYAALLELDPAFSEGWNNLAYALQAAGCYAAAHQAASCATKLAPENPNALDTFREMSQLPADTKTHCDAVIHCPL